jgi:tetratricopeptide (TPR) repeat protein
VLSVPTLAGTLVALAVVGIGAYFWRAYQVGRRASTLTQRAESLAEEKNFTAAGDYYARYLVLCPGDANARLRRAELFEQSTGGRGGFQQAVELYQEALRPASQGLSPERELAARRRLSELMLQADELTAAESEVQKLRELEQKELAQSPEEWRAPGLEALRLAGKVRTFRGDSATEPPATLINEVEEAFKEVLEPETAGKPKVYQDPAVYLARYEYRLQRQLPNAKEDLAAALKLAPADSMVLLTAAAAAQSEAAAAVQGGNWEKAGEFFAKARDYYERGIKAAPADQRAYRGLGHLYKGVGEIDRAIQTWRRGLKEVKSEVDGIDLNLDLAGVLIQQGRLLEAETVLNGLDLVLAKLDPKSKLAVQRLLDLQRAKLLVHKGQYKDAKDVVANLAVGKDDIGATMPKNMIYEAWIVQGQSNAALAEWDQALAAYEQAALLEPGEVAPRLAAAEVCKAAGRRDAAVAGYQQALAIVNALKPPPEGVRQAIYEALIALLEDQKRVAEAERYRTLQREQMAESIRLTLQDVGRAIRDGKADEAVGDAERIVKGRPEDPLAYVALGLAERAKKDDAKALEAYRRAFELTKDVPAQQMVLIEYLLQTRDPSDAAEAEKALRGLLPRYAPAYLRLVGLLELRGKNDEALAVAQGGVEGHPKDPLALVALGTAWWGKNDLSKAESTFQAAAALAPDAAGPATALLVFYAATGRQELARNVLEQMLGKVKLPEIDGDLLRADCLVRIGDRKNAKDAYRKAVEASKEDPAVQMRLAEFLLGSSDPDDEVEGEQLLRRIMRQHDPARRRLAEVLVARGGEQEWEEAQKLLEQSAGDPTSVVDRFVQARSLAIRRGAENLRKAADICQGLLAEAKRPMPGVCLLLARIRELQDNVEEARRQYRALVDQERPPAAQLATYVDFLLRRGPADEADQRLKQLEKLLPADLGTVELRARWLRDQKRAAEIEPLVEGLAQKLMERLDKDKPQQEAQFARAIGDLYQRIEQFPAAERWYRRMLKLTPERYDPLAMSLAKQGRIQEAVALCIEAGKTDTSVRPALLLTMVLVSGRATAQDLASADPYLKKALENHKDQPALLANIANIRVLQDRSGEAIELYRQILAQQPRNVNVLNNLATLLAEQPEPEKRKEAAEYIEQAINLAGPQAGLLDTKAMALLHDGKPDQAVGLLQEATQVPSPDPRWCFHLAVACGRLGQLDKGRAALQQARAGDLDHLLLTKTDRQLLADLEKKLGL